jgi:hypothetical protein
MAYSGSMMCGATIPSLMRGPALIALDISLLPEKVTLQQSWTMLCTFSVVELKKEPTLEI